MDVSTNDPNIAEKRLTKDYTIRIRTMRLKAFGCAAAPGRQQKSFMQDQTAPPETSTLFYVKLQPDLRALPESVESFIGKVPPLPDILPVPAAYIMPDGSGSESR
jgi:hypothetical protein